MKIFPWCLPCRIKCAEDGLLWQFRRLAENADGPLSVDKALREVAAPSLALVGPAARDRYSKELARIFGVSLRAVQEVLRELREAEDGPQQTNKRKKLQPGDFRLGEIILTPRGTEIVKPSQGEVPPFGEVVFTGHLSIESRVLMPGEGEVMIGAVSCPERKLSRPVTLTQESWESRVGFKRAMPTSEFAWYGTDNHLQQLMVHLSKAQVRTVQGTRVLGLNRRDGEWAAVLTDKTFLSNGRETKDLIHYTGGETGIVWSSDQIQNPTRDDYLAFAAESLGFAAPGKASSIVGWLGALVWKARLAQAVSRKFPFIRPIYKVKTPAFRRVALS